MVETDSNTRAGIGEISEDAGSSVVSSPEVTPINAIQPDGESTQMQKRGNFKPDASNPASEETRVKLRCGSTNSDHVDSDRHQRMAGADTHQRLVETISENQVADCGSPPPSISGHPAVNRRTTELSVPTSATTSSRTFNVSFSEPLELELVEVINDFELDETASQRGPPAADDGHAHVRIDPEIRRERRDSEIEGRSLSEVDEEECASQSGDAMDRERRASIDGMPPSAFAFHRSASSRAPRDRDRALYRSPSFTALSNHEPSLAGYSHRDGFLRELSFAGFSIRDETVWRIALEVSLPFVLAGFGMVAAGVVLDIVQHWDFFNKVDQTMIMVPALLGLKGNLEMTLASRMSTQANMGRVRETATWWRIAVANLVLTQAQALVVGFLAALVAMLLCIIKPGSSGIANFDGRTLLLLIASAVCTTSVASLVLGCIIISLITFSKKRKCNPDIIALPIAASLGDMTTLGLLAVIGQSVYSVQPDSFWLLPLLSSITCLIPLWLVLAYRSEHTRQVVATGWLPIILAMAMSSCAGLVLDGVSERFDNLAIFQPVVNGIAGNLAGIQASNLSTRLHQLFEEPGRVTSRFAAARGRSDRSSCMDEPPSLPPSGSRRRRRRFGSPRSEQDSSPSRHDSGSPKTDAAPTKNANRPCAIPLAKINCAPDAPTTLSTVFLVPDLTPITPQNGTTTTSILNGNGTISPTDETASPNWASHNGLQALSHPTSDTQDEGGANVTLPMGSVEDDDDDTHRSSRPPSPPPSLAAVSFRRQRSMSAAWSTLTSAWADDRGLLVRGCFPNPYNTFCGPRMHARTSRVLLYLAIPGHFLFMVLIYFCKYYGQAFYSFLYIALYLVAVFVQIMMLLYITHWLVQFLWKRGNDPDNFAIPYLTATGDIFGSLVLAGVFYLVYIINPDDPITMGYLNETMPFNISTSTALNDSTVGPWYLSTDMPL